MDCPFVIGQRVVCIIRDGEWRDVREEIPREMFPRYMSVWTIRDMQPVIRNVSVINGVWLCLREWPHEDHWYSSGSFRPVKETETDISVFRSLLAPTKFKIREDA